MFNMDIIGCQEGSTRSRRITNVLKYALVIQGLLFVWTYIYDVEQSICDMRRLKPQITLEFIDCVKNNEQQYKRLLEYAELLRIKQF